MQDDLGLISALVEAAGPDLGRLLDSTLESAADGVPEVPPAKAAAFDAAAAQVIAQKALSEPSAENSPLAPVKKALEIAGIMARVSASQSLQSHFHRITAETAFAHSQTAAEWRALRDRKSAGSA